MSRTPIVSQPARLAQEAQTVFDAADQQGRSLTSDERSYVEDLLNRAEERGQYEKRLRDTGLLDSFAGSAGAAAAVSHDPGLAFIQSEGWKSIADSSTRGREFTTGLVEVTGPPMQMKGTLLE